jgi:hypothetical protein
VTVTADTPTNLVVGAGDVLRDHANLGASIDNNLFAIDREIFTPDLNGLKGALMDTDYITSSMGRLETTIPEVSGTVLAALWPGSQTTGVVAGMEVIDEDDTRRIPSADYADWELQVPRLNGGEFQFEVDNAINTGSLEYEAQDDGLVAPRAVVTSRWDPANLTTSPHRIRILDVAS